MFGLLHWPYLPSPPFPYCFSYSGFLAYLWKSRTSPIYCIGLLLLPLLQNVISPELLYINPCFSQVSTPMSSVLIYTISKTITWHINMGSPHFLPYFVLLSLAFCYDYIFSHWCYCSSHLLHRDRTFTCFKCHINSICPRELHCHFRDNRYRDN